MHASEPNDNTAKQAAPLLRNPISNVHIIPRNLRIRNLKPGNTSAIVLNIKDDKSIISLNLSYNNMGFEEITAVRDLLKTGCFITGLDLSGNPLGNESIKILAETLKINNTVKYLKLSNIEVGREGIRELGEMLKANTSITEVDLSCNKIDDEGMIAMAQALKHNKVICCIDLSGNNISDKGEREINIMLKRNTSLIHIFYAKREVSSSNNKLSSSIAKKLCRNQDLYETKCHNISKGYVWEFTLKNIRQLLAALNYIISICDDSKLDLFIKKDFFKDDIIHGLSTDSKIRYENVKNKLTSYYHENFLRLNGVVKDINNDNNINNLNYIDFTPSFPTEVWAKIGSYVGLNGINHQSRVTLHESKEIGGEGGFAAREEKRRQDIKCREESSAKGGRE